MEIFNTGKEFEEVLKEWHYDLIFLDIVMRDRSGIGLGRFVREELGNDVNMIAYASAYEDEYMLGLFQLRPFRFLKKPIRPEDFQNVFCKTCEEIEGDAGTLEPKSSRAACRIPLRDILYFEGDSRRVKIVTTDRTYHCYSTLENLFSKTSMEQASFTWPHKSYAVDLRYMATLSVCMVTLFDGSEFTVSASLKKDVPRRHEGYTSETGMGPGDKPKG